MPCSRPCPRTITVHDHRSRERSRTRTRLFTLRGIEARCEEVSVDCGRILTKGPSENC